MSVLFQCHHQFSGLDGKCALVRTSWNSGALCIVATRGAFDGSRINHSCEPNAVKLRFRCNDEFVESVVTAIRDIHAGEELFVDYGAPAIAVQPLSRLQVFPPVDYLRLRSAKGLGEGCRAVLCIGLQIRALHLAPVVILHQDV